MVNIDRELVEGGLYHIFNRGVEKRQVYTDSVDYNGFLTRLVFYQQERTIARFSDSDFDIADRLPPLHYQLLAYCLMPNHFHLLVQANSDRGISVAISNLLNSYTRSFNTRHQRVGPLFQGAFKSVPVQSDEQLLHVQRYIHLNPYVAGIETVVGSHPWSSYKEYFKDRNPKLCQSDSFFHFTSYTVEGLREFTTDFADYARSARWLQNITLEEE